MCQNQPIEETLLVFLILVINIMLQCFCGSSKSFIFDRAKQIMAIISAIKNIFLDK